MVKYFVEVELGEDGMYEPDKWDVPTLRPHLTEDGALSVARMVQPNCDAYQYLAEQTDKVTDCDGCTRMSEEVVVELRDRD